MNGGFCTEPLCSSLLLLSPAGDSYLDVDPPTQDPQGVRTHKERKPLAHPFFTSLGRSGSRSLNEKHIVAFIWPWGWRQGLGTGSRGGGCVSDSGEGLHSNPGGENGLEVMYSGNIGREDRGHLLDSSYPAPRP